MLFPIIILGIVFILIAVRQVGRVRLPIWMIMFGGAIAVLLSGSIGFGEALAAVNLDVMLFLFGMFVVGQALEESGYLSYLAYRLFRRAKSRDALILTVLFGMGIASAFLMNDTLAIIGTPILLLLAKKHKISSQLLLLTLAFAITIGSVMSPIGNPQNLLIAVHGTIGNPIVSFLRYLFIPTMINLFLAFLLLKFFYHDHFRKGDLNHSREPIRDANLASLSRISLIILVSLIALKTAFFFCIPSFDFRLTYIALFSALPIIVGSRKRLGIVRRIDWATLVFFASMFVLMKSVWDTGYIQTLISSLHVSVLSVAAILAISVILSQLISNVPLVALYLPLLMSAGAGMKEMVALAAGSTIAGNLLILGAASNIIIIQNAESRGEEGFSFLEFAKIGLPLTVLNVLVYYIFLMI